MTAGREELLTRFHATRRELLEAIAGLDPGHLTEPTIDGWSVKDHLFHLAAWDGIRAEEVERISAGHDSTWRMTRDQDAAFNTLIHALHRDLGIEQAFWELARSRERLLAAIDGATPRGLDGSLYGEAGLLSNHEAQHAAWIRGWRTERGY
jgi:uncharacterized damage-inducible protein DinB